VSVINLASHRTVSSVSIGALSQLVAVAIAPDGSIVYVADAATGGVVPIALSGLPLRRSDIGTAIKSPTGHLSLASLGPDEIVFVPQGARAGP
jgi:DNA-binding beta-propeller fold protein YncE